MTSLDGAALKNRLQIEVDVYGIIRIERAQQFDADVIR